MEEYTTISGDTWDNIAFKVYGNEKLAGLLIDANTKYIETVIFSGGIKINVPELQETQQESNLPPWKRALK